MNYKKTDKYDKALVNSNMMGPNPLMILEELTENIPLKPGTRVLDLGCGKGLTSVFLASEYGVQVFAMDLWISATDNYRRFQELGLENSIVPIHADAFHMPFADEYFDAVISVDAYHYFGNNDTFFRDSLRPLLKKNSVLALAFPGVKYEVQENLPPEMQPYWDAQALSTWHSTDWWRPKFDGEIDPIRIWEMNCFQEAWNSWLGTENPYAIRDRAMIRTDNGRYMNLIGITGEVKG